MALDLTKANDLKGAFARACRVRGVKICISTTQESVMPNCDPSDLNQAPSNPSSARVTATATEAVSTRSLCVPSEERLGASRERFAQVVVPALLGIDNTHLVDAVVKHGMTIRHAMALLKLPVDEQFEHVGVFIEGVNERETRVKRKADEKRAVEKSKKQNAGIDVTCVVPGESNLSTALRIINGLDWAIDYFKATVPNEEMQRRYNRILVRARTLIDNDGNVKKIRLFD